MRNLTIILILLVFGSCRKQVPSDSDARLLWKKDLAVGANGRFSFDPNLYDNEGFLTNYAENGKSYFCKMSIENGELLWKHEYKDESRAELVTGGHMYDGKAIFLADKLYVVDMAGGEIIYATQRNGYSTVRSGLDEFAFFNRIIEIEPNVLWKDFGYLYDLKKEGEPEQFLDILPENPLPLPDGRIGGTWRVFPFRNQTGDLELFVDYFSGHDGESFSTDVYIGRYNFTNREWIYKDIPVRGTINDIVVDEEADAVYVADDPGMTKYKLSTGERKWQTIAEPTGYCCDIVMHGDLLIGTYQDTQIAAVNKHNGAIVWTDHSRSTTSEHHIINDILYYASGGGGILYARDVYTGDIIWKTQKDFTEELKVIPPRNGKKAKLIVCSFTHAYCYEAVR